MINNIVNRFILKIIFKLTNNKIISSLLFDNSYLNKTGYLLSLYKCEPVDQIGKPIPWWTYSFVEFLIPRLNTNLRVFEFGSGNSTKSLSKHVKYIHSIEHDSLWYDVVNKTLPENATLKLVTNTEYINSIGDHIYDMIIIDGLFRNDCTFNILLNLSIDGVIVFDDTDRKEYKKSFDF